MQPITTELLKEQLSTRSANKGAVWGLDLRGDEFGALGAKWRRKTLYEPGGAGWPLKRGRSTTDKAEAEEWLEAYATYLERERRGLLAQTNGMLLVTDGGAAYIAAMALVHGSEMRADPPSPERRSSHSVAVGHAETGHRIENLARQLHLNSLSIEGSTSHASTDDRLVSIHGILDHAALAVT